jgi:transcription initiation factor IIE alpha subunit
VDKIIIIIEAEEVLIEEGAEEIIRINIREIKEILMRVINKGIQIFNKEEDNNNLEIRIRLVKHILHNLILFRFIIRTNNKISIKEISRDFRIILINNNFNSHFSNNCKVSNTSNILISTPKINILITKIISSNNNNFRIK